MQVYSKGLFVNYISTCWCALVNQHLNINEKRKIWMNVMFMEVSCIIVIMKKSGVRPWKRGLAWLPWLSAPPHLSYIFEALLTYLKNKFV